MSTHVSRWRWRPHFPHEWTSMLRVRGEQAMQHWGTTARQPDDKERFADFLARDLGIKLPVPFHLQTRAQRLQNIDLQGDFPDQVEPCLALAGFKQAR